MNTIDFHIHFWEKKFISNEFKQMLNYFASMINLEEFPNISYTPETYLAAIEPEKEKDHDFAIKHAIIFPVDYSFTPLKFKISYAEYVEYIIKICDEHQGFFHSLVGPDPRHGSQALELMDYALGQCNFKGLILTPSTGFSLDDLILEKMILKAAEYKVPIIIHDTAVVPRPLILFKEIYRLEEIFSQFGDQQFILSPFSQMDTTLMKVAVRHSTHIMADLTGFDSQFISRKMPEMVMTQFLGMLKETFSSRKIIFGSDWPWWESTTPIHEWVAYIRKMKVPLLVRPFGFPSLEEEDKENILSLNAQRILNLH